LFTEEKTHAAETLDDYRGNWKYNQEPARVQCRGPHGLAMGRPRRSSTIGWPGEPLTRAEHHLQPRPLALPGLALAKGTAGRDDFIVFLPALEVGAKPNMRDVSTLKPIGSAHCPQYNTEAKFYIDAAHKPGKRHLVVHYEKGGHNGAPEFVAGIPDDWSEENVIDLILRPLEDANAQFPAWEVPARAYNCGTLFRWWAGEKPE